MSSESLISRRSSQKLVNRKNYKPAHLPLKELVVNLEHLKKALEQMTDAELQRLSPLSAYGRMAVTPHPRQKEFLDLKCEEALYGGACGGGKTQALLMYLAEGVKIPDYSGILFRRTLTQLEKSNDSPITKSHTLFRPLGGKYNASKYRWTFPSGATIEFGHLPFEGSELNYQGPAYHRVAFDELTQFSEHQYTYLFSRMRMRKEFPVRMGIRAASNPGGHGHTWVKNRFVTSDAIKSIQSTSYNEPSPKKFIFWMNPDRAFVPARVADNPSLDIEDYIARMRNNLTTILRQRLLNGDWSAVEDAVIRPDWFPPRSIRVASTLSGERQRVSLLRPTYHSKNQGFKPTQSRPKQRENAPRS